MSAELVTSEFINSDRFALGIDIGRVILADATDIRFSIFSTENYKGARLVEESIEGIRALGDDNRFAEMHLISKCSPKIQERTLEVLELNAFFKESGVKRENVHFCLHRREKALLAGALGITHFIDDRPDILFSLPYAVRTRLLFVPDPYEYVPRQYYSKKSLIHPVLGWQAARYALLESIVKSEEV